MRRTTNHGFTLIELMVAAAILVTALGAFLTTFNSILKGANYSQGISLASRACLNKLEEIVARNFSDIRRIYGVAPGNTFTFNTSSVLGITGIGSINITDRRDLYGGGEHCATDNASWPVRLPVSLVYDNKMWVIGGYGYTPTGSCLYNDVWNSTDGISWNQTITNASWSVRAGHTSIVYDNKMWVIGGSRYSQARYNDVWYSTDGKNWIQATANAGWSGRSSHSSVAYDNKMWVLGGYNGSYLNDVWYSTDGINWTPVTTNSPMWSARGGSSVVYDNKMWVIGGYSGSGVYHNDVWWTDDLNFSDGQTWTRATPAAAWPARGSHTSVVYDNKMWVICGEGPNNGNWRNDIWYSTDGINWTQVTPDVPTWPQRAMHASVVYDNKMWVMGGLTTWGGYENDIWYSNGYDRILEVLITVSWRQPDGRIFGEDTNLDGVWNNTTEDPNNNGRYDSPAQLRVLLSEKNIVELRKTFLGKRE